MSLRSVMLRALGALYAVLWAGGLVAYLFLGGPPAGTGWTAPAFLATASALAFLLSPRGEWPALAFAGLWGFTAEVAGVFTGFPFGEYAYTDALGPRLARVPLVMAGAWIVLFAWARQCTAAGPRAPLWRAAAGAAWMVAADLVIDPLAASALGYWTWAEPGRYQGIPATNFAGWYGVAFCALWIAERTPVRPHGARWLGWSVVAFFTAIAFGRGLALPGAIGLALCAGQAVVEFRRRSRPRGDRPAP